jgi:hypothetical protein
VSAPAKQTSWRRIVVLGSIWAATSAAALLAPGCYGRNCDPGFETFGLDDGQGEMIDENTWASGPIDGEWLWYPRQRLYSFEIPALGGRTPVEVIPYVAASPEPMKNFGNFTVGAGNIALLGGARANHVEIRNDTCSDYYLRLVVRVRPFAPETDGGAPDDGGTADASTEDAASDANDADTDSGT